MTNETIQECRKNGIIILRSQHDARKGKWKIVRMTWNGPYSHGWTRFNNSWDFTVESCERRIDRIVEGFPGQYIKDF